jgi:hypothetical protein
VVGPRCWVVMRSTEMNRVRLVLFDMNNRMDGPYLATIHRILISVMAGCSRATDDHREPAALAIRSTHFPAFGFNRRVGGRCRWTDAGEERTQISGQ